MDFGMGSALPFRPSGSVWRWIGLLTLLGVVLLGSLSIPPPARAGAPAVDVLGASGSGWIADVVVDGAGGSQRNPALATGPGGLLLTAYEDASAGNGDILLRMSADAGLTWTPAIPIASTASAEVNPTVAFDPFSGRMFIAWQLGTAGATAIMSAYSDDGATWVTGTAFACGVLCERPRIASEYWRGASNYQYIVFAGQLSANDWDVAFLRSVNQGQSWSLLFEDSTAVADTRFQPEIAVQRGTDAVGRVVIAYRAGTSPATAGDLFLEWSEDYGATWQPRTQWALADVDSPLTLKASHDGDSLMVAYSRAANDITWIVDQDPTSLAWDTSNSLDRFYGAGYWPALAVDGDGTTDTTIGGRYHLVAHDAGGLDLIYAAAHTTMTAQSDWSAPAVTTDTTADASDSYILKSVATQLRGAWYPVVAWTDFRNGGLASQDVMYGTPGAQWSLDTNPPGLLIAVDATPRTAPFVASFPAGTQHTIAAPSPQFGPGTQSTFVSWSDAGPQSRTVVADTTDRTLVATFSTQVQLTLVSAYGGVTGQGWYPINTVANINATNPLPTGPGRRYLFAAWTGSITSYLSTAQVLMNEPKTITANWLAQYLLNVTSAHGNVTGGGWYTAGLAATLRVGSAEVVEGGRTWAFTGWSGDATGNLTTLTVSMSGPKAITANWEERFTSPFAGTTGALLLAGILLAVLLGILALVMMRRRRRPQATFQQMQPMSGLGTPPPQAPPTPPPEHPMPSWPQPPPGSPPP